MPSKFLMQVIDRETGKVVSNFEPGLSVEINFIDDCVTRILDKNIGILKTKYRVEQAVRAGMEEALQDLKSQVRVD